MIKKARFDKKISQKKLGEYIGVTQSCVSKIERRKSKSLSIQKVLDISLVLELDPVEVFIFLAHL